MTRVVVAGGVYEETCLWPHWTDLFGSGGRAAAALTKQIDEVELYTYVSDETFEKFKLYGDAFNFKINKTKSDLLIGFHYLHSLADPFVTPAFDDISRSRCSSIDVSSDVVLRFGMLEGDARVSAKKCVYDPQQPNDPEQFSANGSVADDLVIIGNVDEITKLGGSDDCNAAAATLLSQNCSTVIVKGAAAGAVVYTPGCNDYIPAFKSDFVWTVGSGDIFSANFAAQWAALGVPPVEAALIASRAVAEYASTRTLPTSLPNELSEMPFDAARQCNNSIYLAGPFFTIGQRLFIDSARACLVDLGLDVFSPVHDVGFGGIPFEVASADLEAIDRCDALFAVLDGLDAGTLFEIGYAKAKEKPVYILSQTVSQKDLLMMVGTGCRVYEDFVTAAYHMAWGA